MKRNYKQQEDSSKRPRTDDSRGDDYRINYIFTILQEQIYSRINDQNILYSPRPVQVPNHMKDRNKFCAFRNDYGHRTAK